MSEKPLRPPWYDRVEGKAGNQHHSPSPFLRHYPQFPYVRKGQTDT